MWTPSPVPAQVHADVCATLVRYSRGIDTKDWVAFRSCFTGDCVAVYGELSWDGAESLTNEFAAAHDPLDASMHRVLNIEVTAYGEPSLETRSLCDAVLIRRDAPGCGRLQVTGVYSDRLARGDDGLWRIARREFRAVDYHGDLAVMGLDVESVRRGYDGAFAIA